MNSRLLKCPGCKFTVEVYNTEQQIICPVCRLWRMYEYNDQMAERSKTDLQQELQTKNDL